MATSKSKWEELYDKIIKRRKKARNYQPSQTTSGDNIAARRQLFEAKEWEKTGPLVADCKWYIQLITTTVVGYEQYIASLHPYRWANQGRQAGVDLKENPCTEEHNYEIRESNMNWEQMKKEARDFTWPEWIADSAKEVFDASIPGKIMEVLIKTYGTGKELLEKLIELFGPEKAKEAYTVLNAAIEKGLDKKAIKESKMNWEQMKKEARIVMAQPTLEGIIHVMQQLATIEVSPKDILTKVEGELKKMVPEQKLSPALPTIRMYILREAYGKAATAILQLN